MPAAQDRSLSSRSHAAGRAIATCDRDFRVVHAVQSDALDRLTALGGNMWKRVGLLRDVNELETRVVVLEAALAWIQHESTRADDGRGAMERIAVLAREVLADDDGALVRMRHRMSSGAR